MIEVFLKAHSIDILCISEHWICSDISNINFPGYEIVSHFTRKLNIHIYRPPSGNIDIFIASLSNLLQIAFSKVKYIILAGDLNIDYLKKYSLKTNLLSDILDSYNFNEHVSIPPRVFTNQFRHTSTSCIDYLVTN
nr:unnamed protein product [Callosobruchus analis]